MLGLKAVKATADDVGPQDREGARSWVPPTLLGRVSEIDQAISADTRSGLGTLRTWRDIRLESVMRFKPDIVGRAAVGECAA